jgi:hypothetical protein
VWETTVSSVVEPELGVESGVEEMSFSTGGRECLVVSTPSPDLLDARGQFLNKVVHRAIRPDHVLHLVVGVENGGVVAVAEVLPDLR